MGVWTFLSSLDENLFFSIQLVFFDSVAERMEVAFFGIEGAHWSAHSGLHAILLPRSSQDERGLSRKE
jgi:hypothetical protein